MLDELRSMAVFATVVREGSFRAAAKQLQLSTSVVSHHVTQLERRLGCALLYRTTRKLSLTPDGEHFFEACSRSIDAAQEGLERIQTLRKTMAGRLRVGAPAILAQGPFARDVQVFAQAHPAVDLELLFTDERQNQVAESIDVAIRIGWLEDSTLRARKLFEVRRVLCAAPALLADHPPIRTPADLCALPWIASTALPDFLDLSSPHGDILIRSPNRGHHGLREALSTAGRFGRLRRTGDRPAVGNAVFHCPTTPLVSSRACQRNSNCAGVMLRSDECRRSVL